MVLPQYVEDFPVQEIPIYPTGDAGGFHFKNDPNDPDQRDTIIQRKGRVNISCDHKDVVHGYLSDDDDSPPCTLIVVRFRFDPNGIAARIKEVHVVVKFAAMEPGRPDPEVIAMQPEGNFSVVPTTRNEQVTKSGGANIGGTVTVVQAGATLNVEKTTNHESTDYTKVHGSIDVLRGYGKKNAVSWNLFENATEETGVVTSLQGAIMLKRRTKDRFKATISIHATADTLSRIISVFKKDEKDDDVLYNPEKPATNRLRKYDVDNLGKIELGSLSDVTFCTVMKGGIKEQ